MATHKMGRIREVSVRELWDHEAHDFTRWLADNIDRLGAVLQIDLEHRQTEMQVGAFSLDILARDTGRDLTVVIENQLEWTDHGHLGQLLTYAAGLDAGVVVWITPHFRDEHRAAIDWLNRKTSDEVEFFGVEVRAIEIIKSNGEGGEVSLPAPEFRPVAFPNHWTRGGTGAGRSPGALVQQKLLDFFQPVVGKLRQQGFTRKPNAQKGGVQRFKDNCVESTWYCAWFWKNFAVVSVTLFNKVLYESLEECSGEIERDFAAASLSGDLKWHNPKAFQYSEVRLQIKGSIDDPPEKLDETRGWMVESLPKFKAILNPRIEEVVAELGTETPPAQSDLRPCPERGKGGARGRHLN